MITAAEIFARSLSLPTIPEAVNREVILHGIGVWRGRRTLNICMAGTMIEIELGKRRIMNPVAYEIFQQIPDLRMTVLREIVQ